MEKQRRKFIINAFSQIEVKIETEKRRNFAKYP
jgi:hypothetical protein